jgi:hypothetical protein
MAKSGAQHQARAATVGMVGWTAAARARVHARQDVWKVLCPLGLSRVHLPQHLKLSVLVVYDRA